MQARAGYRRELLSLHINQKSKLWHHCPTCTIMGGWSPNLIFATHHQRAPEFLVPTLMKDLNESQCVCATTFFACIIVTPCDGTASA